MTVQTPPPHEGMIFEDAGGLQVWRWPAAPVNTTPATITRAQGKAALIQAGLWAAVLQYVASIADDTERALADVALNDTLQWQRTSPFLSSAAAALGLSDEQLDALFAAAAAIEL